MIDAPLAPVLRRARILDRVQRDGGASISEPASELAASPDTVHRDLELSRALAASPPAELFLVTNTLAVRWGPPRTPLPSSAPRA